MFEKIMDILHFLYHDIKNQPLYYGTMILGIFGAFGASDAKASIRFLGYFAWVFSNGYLLYQYYNHKNISMTIMFAVYQILNARGLWNNFSWTDFGF
jgi:hypothetical protein